MLKLNDEEKRALKARGIILTNDGTHFIERVISPNGVFTAGQLQAIAGCAEKYGNGKAAMTTRLTVEIQGLPYENVEACFEEIQAAGLYIGGTSSLVRPVVSCKGTVCVHGLMDTQGFCERIFNEYYLKWHTVRLPHKFKIGIGGCPNNCVKPGFNDFGIMGQSVPDYDPELCNACSKCLVVGTCPVKALRLDGDGHLVMDDEKCTNCGKCVGACLFDSIEEKARGYRVTIGGIWGKTQREGTPVPGIYSEEEVMKLIETALLLYREQGITGERFGRTIDRIGAGNFISQLLSGDVLARKQEILDAKLHLTGGATC